MSVYVPPGEAGLGRPFVHEGATGLHVCVGVTVVADVLVVVVVTCAYAIVADAAISAAILQNECLAILAVGQ